MKKIAIIVLLILGGIFWVIYGTGKNTKKYQDQQASSVPVSSEPVVFQEASDEGSETDLTDEEIEDIQASTQSYSDWSSATDQGESPFPPPYVEEVDGVMQRTMHMGVRQWEWFPEKITANYGEEVIIIMHNADVTHSISIPELNVKQDIPDDGAVVQFMSVKRGTFSFFCDTPCGKGHDQMKGEITIL